MSPFPLLSLYSLPLIAIIYFLQLYFYSDYCSDSPIFTYLLPMLGSNKLQLTELRNYKMNVF